MEWVIIQWPLTVECGQNKCATLPLEQLGKSALPRKKVDRDRTKVMIDHKKSEGRKRSFKCCQGSYMYIDIDLHQLSWWRHQMDTFSAVLPICAGNSLVTGEFPTQRPVTRSFDVFFDLRLNNKRLSKQSWGWWFETPSCPLRRHCNGGANRWQ